MDTQTTTTTVAEHIAEHYKFPTPEVKAADFNKRLGSEQEKVQAALKKLGRSQVALYEALAAGPYTTFREFQKQDEETRGLISKVVNSQLTDIGVRTQESTDDLARFVKLSILGGGSYAGLPDKEKDQRRRDFTVFSSVLRVAYQRKVEPEKLPTWIQENGGVENIKSGKVETKAEAKAKKEAQKNAFVDAANKLSERTLGEFKAGKLNDEIAGFKKDKPFVIVATWSEAGTIVMHAAMQDAAAVTAATKAFQDALGKGDQGDAA